MEVSIDGARDFSREQDVALAKLGDKEAFSRLIEKDLKYLYRISRPILQNDADVEDSIQETIIKAWTQISSLKDNAYFKTWVIRILINQCNEIIRKQKKVVPSDQLQNSSDFYSDSSESFSVRDAIYRLDKDLRSAIILYYFEDMTCSEVAYALNIPEGTVKSRLSRAKKKLSESLKDDIDVQQ